MASVNKVILIGNLGKDPELRYTPAGLPVATFSLATTERYTDKNGQRQDKTEWHAVVAWRKLAELANQYLKKGRSVYVEGKLTTRSWDDKDGNKRYKTEIVANTIEFLGSGSSSSSADHGQSSDQPMPDYDMRSPSGPDLSAPVSEDDLPF